MEIYDKKKDNLAIKNPKLSQQWHPTKNGALTPSDVKAGSGKKVWWVCEKGHEWEATILNRTNGRDCPYCSGRYAYDDNSLRTLNPELAKQWHPTKNGDLTPDRVTVSAGKKVWWICDKGHEWEATINSRTSGRGCPFCSGKRVCDDNSLQTSNPELAKYWHPTKNGDLTPGDVTVGSDKKVWWVCEKKHEWEATISNRVNGRGCPFCSGKRVCDDNSLQTSNPELSKHWHPTKNGELTPGDVTAGSDKKVWWQCENGHEWEATISSRVSGNGCPFCSGLRACDDNSLQTLNPELSKCRAACKNEPL